MASSFDEAGVTCLFAETILCVKQRGVAIDEEATVRSVSREFPFLPILDVAEREGEECVKRALEQLSGEAGAAVGPTCANDADVESEGAFVDVVDDGERGEVAQSEGLTFADALICAKLLSDCVQNIPTAVCLVSILHFH